MQDDVVVGGVAVVAVGIPFFAACMYLDVARPCLAGYAYLGVEEVWPGVEVLQPGVDDLYLPAVGGSECRGGEYAVFPAVL